ncbi:hypothetical protein [Desertivirga arenae]|nr:hypothetical protein [Pedobacter sp. SYSU D00823]
MRNFCGFGAPDPAATGAEPVVLARVARLSAYMGFLYYGESGEIVA